MIHQDKNWSEELEKYQSGNQTDSERYQLEKAALDDAFLFEALEGYTLYQNASTNKAVQPGPSESGAKIFSLRNIAVAASLLLLVGMVGYMQSNFNQDAPAIAEVGEVNSLKDISSTDDRSIAMNVESTSSEEVLDDQDEKMRIETEPSQIGKVIVESDEMEKPKLDTQEKKKSDGIVIPDVSNTAKITSVTRVNPQSPSPNSGKVEAKPKLSKNASQDNEKDRVEKENATGPNVSLKLKEESASSLAPVASRDAMSATSSESKYRNNYITPPNGWAKFDSYIKDGAKGTKSLKPVRVIINATFDKDGKILTLKSNKTSCSACVEKAKSLIREAGAWANSSNSNQLVNFTIEF